MKILFVCTGNTCRSPIAAALMNKIAAENDLQVSANSAGIFAEAGSPASKHAIEAMKQYNIDLTKHQAVQLSEKLIEESDLVLTMTEGHKTMISTHAPKKTFTICEYAGYNGEIHDPYGGTLSQYNEAAENIYDCLTDIAEKIYDLTGNESEN